MRVALFIVVAIGIFALVAWGAYLTMPYWQPVFLDGKGAPDGAAIRMIVVVFPAAIATVVAALIAGVASLISANAQRSANNAIETRRGEIMEDLDRKRNDLAKDLEDTKNVHLKALEEHRATLTAGLENHRQRLALRLAKIEDEIEQRKQARETATLYRFVIGSIRQGRFAADEAKPCHLRLRLCKESLDDDSPLYKAWCIFMERGHYLEALATGITATEQIALWNSPSPKTGRELGLEFADSAEDVLTLIRSEIAQVRADA